MKIGIIGGTGPQGLGIAKRLAISVEDLIVGSRKEEKALTVVEEANEEIKEYNPKELVGMANEDAAAAAKAIEELDGAEYFGRNMVVKEARPPKY